MDHQRMRPDMERAVLGRSGERQKHAAVEAIGGHVVADVLGGIGRRGANDGAQSPERGSLLGRRRERYASIVAGFDFTQPRGFRAARNNARECLTQGGAALDPILEATIP